MNKLSRDQLFSLEQYATERAAFRAQVIEHKKPRRVQLGEHLVILFEDRLTMQYQIQEMLRIERIFEPAAIEEELEAYNPLIPDGANLKATMQIEYGDVDERRDALAKLIGIEHKIWVEGGGERSYAIANEDLERSTDEKTSAVHFLRFELGDALISALCDGGEIKVGSDHPAMSIEKTLDEASTRALAADVS